MKKFLCTMLFLVSSAALWAYPAVVTVPVLPTTDDQGKERDDEMLLGMTCQVDGEPNEAGLVAVTTEYRYTTYVNPHNLKKLRHLSDWVERRNYRIEPLKVDVLPQPKTESFPPIVSLPRGAWIYASESDKKDWAKIELPDGTVGFVKWVALRKPVVWNQNGEDITRKRLIDDAQKFLGVAYRWGGKTADGLDCSGLTSLVYDLNGLGIYRNSRPEAGYAVAVLTPLPDENGRWSEAGLKKQGLKEGDLLFWPGHTGMYLGKGKYIHANGATFDTCVNSLLKTDPDFREDLADPLNLVAFGTAFPQTPHRLIVRKAWLEKAQKEGVFGYYLRARIDGYMPTEVRIDPNGDGDLTDCVVVNHPRRMLLDPVGSTHKDLPFIAESQIGQGLVRFKLINSEGYGAQNQPIESQWIKVDRP